MDGTIETLKTSNARLRASNKALLEALVGLTQLGTTDDGGIIIGPQGWKLARALIKKERP